MAVFAGTLLVAFGVRAAEIPNVAAASDLQFALTDVAAAFKRATGSDVRLSFGSSGNFRRQIADGAPFELFLSADAGYADALVQERRTVDAGTVYAIGRLALFAAGGSPVTPDPQLRDVAAALADGRLRKFAIANPDHAPYGRAARQVLTRTGLWTSIEPRLVLGENVSQAAQFATSGAAQAAIVAYALVRAPGMAARGRFVLLPAADHDPLVQKMVLLKHAGATARAFYAFLQSPRSRTIFARYGFEAPSPWLPRARRAPRPDDTSPHARSARCPPGARQPVGVALPWLDTSPHARSARCPPSRGAPAGRGGPSRLTMDWQALTLSLKLAGCYRGAPSPGRHPGCARARVAPLRRAPPHRSRARAPARAAADGTRLLPARRVRHAIGAGARVRRRSSAIRSPSASRGFSSRR